MKSYADGYIEGLTTFLSDKGKVIHKIIFRGGKAVNGYLVYEKKAVAFGKEDLADFEVMYK